MPHPENHVEDLVDCTGLFADVVEHLKSAA
jgi:hypothetical protein